MRAKPRRGMDWRCVVAAGLAGTEATCATMEYSRKRSTMVMRLMSFGEEYLQTHTWQLDASSDGRACTTYSDDKAR